MSRPPFFGAWLLRLLRRQGDSDLVLGDLEEEYSYLYQRQGRQVAARWYWQQVIRSVPRFIYELVYWWVIMLENYFKVSVRNLRKHPGFAFINIAGLALGLAACFVITLFLVHKLSYDRFHPNAERMYRVIQETDFGVMAPTPPGLAKALEENFPELEQVTLVKERGQGLFVTGADSYFIDNVFVADPSFFKVFGFEILQGNPETILTAPGHVVLTESEAQKLFGDRQPMGQVLRYENTRDLEVVGIVADPPSNAHFHFNVLVAYSERQQAMREGSTIYWQYFGDYLYVVLQEGHTAESFVSKLRTFEEAAEKPEWLSDKAPGLFVEPVVDIHLYSEAKQDIAPQSDIRYLYLFGSIAVLVLIIAGVNYMNLATARSAMRYREVGVRKAVGAMRAQLIGQFLSESIVVALLAFGLALLLVQGALPLIKQAAGIDFTFSYVQYLTIAAGFMLVVLGVGFVAGSYPAFFLARFEAVQILGGGYRQRTKGTLRKTLIVFQFAVSVALLLATIIIHQQQRYVHNQRLGFDKEQIVYFRAQYVKEQFDAFKATLLRTSAIESVASGPPIGLGWKSMTITIEDEQGGPSWDLGVMGAGYDYVNTAGIEILQGRALSREFPADAAQSVLVNELAAHQLGISDDPLGQMVQVGEEEKTVVGVMRDFHNASLHTAINPLVLRVDTEDTYIALVRLAPQRMAEGLQHLEATWAQFVPERPLQYTFLEDRLETHYQLEQRLGHLFTLFAGLAVLIACLGMFGLAAFTAEQRTKEIGIRKAVGASSSSIVSLFAVYFVKLVVVGFGIAAPVSYVLMERWLATFAYHVPLSGTPFVVAGSVILVLALLAVSYQAFKAASANPVEALRYE